MISLCFSLYFAFNSLSYVDRETVEIKGSPMYIHE